MPDPVFVSFLGGLGEIGRNCACVEVEGRIMILDCGLMFPDTEMLGIDLVLPDFTYLRENADRVDVKHRSRAKGRRKKSAGVTEYRACENSLALVRNRVLGKSQTRIK